MLRKRKLLILLAVLGGIAGWLFWRYVGCLNGSCMIWSNPWIATAYGILIGYLVGGLFPRKDSERDETDTDATIKEM
ncbi:MAG: hypothetical protein P9L92_13005 [Candidatus Electryonea clarkiae]|nr:hypothetical protein [Candidatus Electryonea clarkiae]MDP8286457.1 hypothetical protein [Candidatus Electryonea clarkiae]